MNEIETEIEDLARDAMRDFHSPYSQDIKDQVFCVIEQARFRHRYDELKKLRGISINARIGTWIQNITELESLERCHTPRSILIKSYLKLG